MTAKKPGFATHYLRYSTGNVLVILAGLVSFPILTRLLDNTQYGILNYYDSWVLMAVAFGKLGAQHAIMRFYPHGGDVERLRAFSTNLFYLPLAISLALWALAMHRHRVHRPRHRGAPIGRVLARAWSRRP